MWDNFPSKNCFAPIYTLPPAASTLKNINEKITGLKIRIFVPCKSSVMPQIINITVFTKKNIANNCLNNGFDVDTALDEYT